MGVMTRRRLALAILAGFACFGAGVGAARFFAGGGREAPRPPVEPRVVIDPASIKLLDASLRLDLPPDFDAGP